MLTLLPQDPLPSSPVAGSSKRRQAAQKTAVRIPEVTSAQSTAGKKRKHGEPTLGKRGKEGERLACIQLIYYS